MIIYFDFSLGQIKLIKQQNDKQSFAVDFLIEKSQKKDFAGIIDELFEKNDQIAPILSKEKNYVILPDQVVGFDNLEVPSVKFGFKNKFFKTKFDLLFNQKNNMSVFENLYYKDKFKSIFQFVLIKKDIITQIVDGFKKHGVEINGISYFSAVLAEYLSENYKLFQKSNCLVVFNNESVDLFAYANGLLLGTRKVEIANNSQSFAKKFAKFTQNRQNLTKYLDQNFENSILQTKVERPNEEIVCAKYDWQISEFMSNFEKSNLNIKFNKAIVINRSFDIKLEAIDIVDLSVTQLSEILCSYKKSTLYSFKRSFWS